MEKNVQIVIILAALAVVILLTSSLMVTGNAISLDKISWFWDKPPLSEITPEKIVSKSPLQEDFKESKQQVPEEIESSRLRPQFAYARYFYR